MAFPSTSGTNAVTLDRALFSAMTIAGAVKAQAQSYASLAGQGLLNGQQIVSFPAWLNSQNSQLTALAGTAGLAAYAQNQIGNATFDIAAAFTTMQNAITSTVNWIISNFPKDTGNFLQYATFDGSGNVVYTVFTAAQLSGFISVLNSLIATIN